MLEMNICTYRGPLVVFSRHILLVLGMLLISGCAIDSISPKDPTTYIPDRSAEINVGQMEREVVRNNLGKPPFSSAYWGFDLFRAETEQTNVPYAITPWPIPFARIKDKLYRYTLVNYDAKGITSAIATGIFRRPTDWRSASPIKHDFQTLHLRTGDLMFYADPAALRENILGAPTARDNYFQLAHSSAGCMVVVGCGDRGCGDQLAVDEGEVRRLPLQNYVGSYAFVKESSRMSWLQGVEQAVRGSNDQLETLVAVKLPPGKHLLEFSNYYIGGKDAVNFACRPGELTYITVSASDNNRFINHLLVDWRIEQSDKMPESFEHRPLVLLYDGQWYVDAEP
jgi:hypothetical protein